tara:strand:- start:8294 stop:8908 length:615 start_codon:yes stop_codon:yes gene_type:complete
LAERQTREIIKKYALKLFAQHGFEKCSVRMITHAAGVNLGAVNYHFRSKDHLLKELIDEFGDKFILVKDQLQPVSTREQFNQCFEKFIHTLMDLFLSDMHVVSMFFTETELLYTKCESVLREKYIPTRSALDEFLKDAQSKGLVDPEVSVYIVTSTVFGLFGDEVRRIQVREKWNEPHIGQEEYHAEFFKNYIYFVEKALSPKS